MQQGQTVQTGLISFVLRTVATAFFFLLMSLFFSIISEWVGMTFWWPEERLTHSQRMYETELRYLNEDFKETFISADPVVFAKNFSDQFYELLFVKTRLVNALEWAERPVGQSESKMRVAFHEIYNRSADFLLASIYTIKTFGVRLAVLAMAMPLFIMFAFVGACDGLVQRDVRRWCGGRESSLVYSYSKHMVMPSLYGCWVIYLALPISMHPSLVLLPFASLFALSLAVMAGSFKKYV